jgi:Protein of unknown function (DUF4242)
MLDKIARLVVLCSARSIVLTLNTVLKETNMQLYTIRRRQAWGSPEEVQAVAKRAKEVADSDFPDEVRWIRSYVLADNDGTLGSLCVYQAVNADAIRRHSQRVGMPADEINEALETVLVRPDPAPASATA